MAAKRFEQWLHFSAVYPTMSCLLRRKNRCGRRIKIKTCLDWVFIVQIWGMTIPTTCILSSKFRFASLLRWSQFWLPFHKHHGNHHPQHRCRPCRSFPHSLGSQECTSNQNEIGPSNSVTWKGHERFRLTSDEFNAKWWRLIIWSWFMIRWRHCN